jgi:hypothetical protein
VAEIGLWFNAAVMQRFFFVFFFGFFHFPCPLAEATG